MAQNDLQIKISVDGAAAANTQLQEVSKNLGHLQAQSKQGGAAVDSMRNAVGQLGWVLGDSATFMTSFRMGMMSIGNNIPMVVQGLLQAKNAAAETGMTMKQALVGAITGGGGVMLAINGLMLLMQVLPALFKDTTEEVNKQSDALDELRTKYDKLTLTQIQAELDKLYFTAASRTGKGGANKPIFEYMTEGEQQLFKVLQDLKRDRGVLEEINKQIDELTNKRNKLNEDPKSANWWGVQVLGALNYASAVALLNKDIDKLKEKQDALTGKEGKSSSAGKSGRASAASDPVSELIREINLRVELAELKGTDAEAERVQGVIRLAQFFNENLSLQQEVSLLKEIARLKKSITPGMTLEREIGSLQGLPIERIKNGAELMQPVAIPQLTKANELLSLQKDLIQGIGTSLSRAGQQSLRAMTSTIMIFQQANSVLQQFINNLAQMLIEMAAIAAFKWLLNFVTGGTGSTIMDTVGTAGEFMGGSVRGPNIGDVLERAASAPVRIVVNVAGETKLKGSDIYTSYRRQDTIVKRFG